MTATNDASDPRTTAEERWRHIEDRLAAIEHRIREHGNAAVAAADAHLARLAAIRHSLAHRPWPPHSPTPATPPQPAQAPVESPPATVGHQRARTVPDESAQPGAADSHPAAIPVPA
ncbi:hypothetical protein AB0K51_12845 [Kitasatospora sp. NPDC049285]|uniref:hypothetical protein n=1 Tax=Kitasatospora sp. NPDC049285 TaxID=3157096 RepID=UPI00341F4FC0